MRRHPQERTYYSEVDDAAEEFFRQAAKNEALSYHDWCKKYGVMDAAALQKIARHEAVLYEGSLASGASKQRPSEVNRQGRYSHRWAHRVTNDAADRNWQVDPPFEPIMPSDLDPAPNVAPRRRLPSREGPADAAAE